MKRIIGPLLTVEGIDGSGKTEIIKTWKKYLSNYEILDKRDKKWGNPSFDGIPGHDVIVVCEPAQYGLGKFIRDILIRKDSEHRVEAVAQAYAMDRKFLYENIILPATGMGKIVIQDRSIASSMVYQPIQAEMLNEEVDLDYILNLWGNEIAIENPPDLLVIADLPAKVAVNRLNKRGKKDYAKFEKPKFLSKIRERYVSDWLKDFFEEKGTKVKYVDTSGTIEATQKQAARFLEDFLKEKKFIG